MFDLYLLPIYLKAHLEQSDLPGFLAVNAPRRAARNRAEDSCLIFINPNGASTANPAVLEKYAQKLAEDYFRTAGSVTAGVRAAVDNLNEFLLNSNLEHVRSGQTLSVTLNMAIVHNDQLFVVQAGVARSLVISKNGIEDFQDSSADHGLGVSRSAGLRYYQAQLQEGDILLFWNKMPPGFIENLQTGMGKHTLEQFRRQVLSQVDAEARLALVQFRTGKGQLHLLKPRAGQQPAAEVEKPGVGVEPAAEGPKAAEVVKQAPRPEIPAPQVESLPQAVPPLEKPAADKENTPPVEPVIGQQNAIPVEPAAAQQNAVPAEPAAVIEPVVEEKADSGVDDLIPINEETQKIVAPLKPQESVQLSQPETAKPAVEKPGGARPVQALPLPLRVTAEVVEPSPNDEPSRKARGAGRTDWLAPLTALLPRRPAKVKAEGPLSETEGVIPEDEIDMQPVTSRRNVEPEVPEPLKPLQNNPGDGTKKEKTSFRRLLASIWFGGKAAQQRVDQDGRKLLTNVLPGEPAQEGLRLSPAMMLFIAIAVPLIVVSMATTIYFRNGPGKQFQTYLSQAQTIASQSKKQSDLDLRRKGWVQIIDLLDKAEKYGMSDESRTLRIQVQQALDTVDGITRINFQPIATTLDSAIQITRLAANDVEVYLLGSTQGRVLRLYRAGQGYNYTYDPSFVCGPGMVGTSLVDRLVGMALLPKSNPTRATVMAMDKSGNLLYCIPGSQPLANVLPAPEKKIPLGDVTNFKLDGDVLYVLDEKNNAIYIYLGSDLAFSDPPHQYFDQEIPNLKNAADMVFNGDDLFLLHEDGLMTKCTFRASSFFQTHCVDPSPYHDTRPGREGDTRRFANTHFAQIQATDPPDPSIYILDVLSSTLFQFGLGQSLNSQVRMQVYPDFTLPTRPASAFTIGSNRVVWIAYGNEVFFAPQ